MKPRTPAQQRLQKQEKIRTPRVSHQGIKSKLRTTKQKKSKKRGQIETIISLSILSVTVLATIRAISSQPTCNIKGNISISTGRKLYHLPGMKDYDRTNISPEYGERWFCTEEEAIANGWSKAPR